MYGQYNSKCFTLLVMYHYHLLCWCRDVHLHTIEDLKFNTYQNLNAPSFHCSHIFSIFSPTRIFFFDVFSDVCMNFPRQICGYSILKNKRVTHKVAKTQEEQAERAAGKASGG